MACCNEAYGIGNTITSYQNLHIQLFISNLQFAKTVCIKLLELQQAYHQSTRKFSLSIKVAKFLRHLAIHVNHPLYFFSSEFSFEQKYMTAGVASNLNTLTPTLYKGN